MSTYQDLEHDDAASPYIYFLTLINLLK